MGRRSSRGGESHEGLPALTRRKLLVAGAVGGSTLLAGCPSGGSGTDTPTDGGGGNDVIGPDAGDGGGDGATADPADGTPTPVPDIHVEGQELRLPTPNNPQEMYFAFQIGNEVDSRFSAPGDLYAATHEPGVWGRFFDSLYWPRDVPETYPGLYESWEITGDTISVTIRENAYWSDGEPIRAKDAIAPQALWKEAPKWRPSPTETRFHIGAIGDYSMPDGPDGKTYELHVVDNQEWEEFGGFDPYGEGEILARIGGTGGVFQTRAGVAFPTHLDPYESVVDEAIAIWDERPQDLEGLVLQHVTGDWDSEIHEWSRRPENIVTSGAWTVSELRGAQEVVLEPNEHSRHAENVNFDRVVFEYSESEQRTRAGVQATTYDTGEFTASPQELPSIPDRYEQVLSPAGQGYSLGLDHNSFFGDRLVRQAFMFALDTEAIAGNIHPDTTRPITLPGFDHWGVGNIISESWAQENLIDYSQDTDRAASLMREAGFEKQSGVWHRDGEPFQITVATSRDTPVMETTVVDQLSDFGIDAAFQTFENANFTQRVRGANVNQRIDDEYDGSGDFTVWSSAGPEDAVAGHYKMLWHHWWWGLANARRVRRRNYFAHDTQETALSQYASNGWVRGNYPLWEEWTIDVPPIGEPDGNRQPFNPGYTWGQVRTGPATFNSDFESNPHYNPPADGGLEYWTKQYAWLLNWWLPVLPLVLERNQSFVNTANWNFPTDHHMWQYFNIGWDDDHLVGMNRVFANPDNPKSGANVVEE